MITLLKLLQRLLFAEPLATTRESILEQADRFLERNGFPVDSLHRQAFGTFVQHLPQSQDYFIPSEMAATIRRAKCNEAAYYGLINPPKEEPANEQQGDKAADSEVVPQAG